jgi:hypothetical protein
LVGINTPATSSLTALDTGTTYNISGFTLMNAPASMASFVGVHYGFSMILTKPQSGATTSGTWENQIDTYGVGGQATDFFTGLVINEIPNCTSSINCGGTFTASNPVVAVPAEMTPFGITGEEVDVQSFAVASNLRQGARIGDVSGSSGVQSLGDDDGIAIVCFGGPCWKNGLTFGDETGGIIPVTALTGSLITTQASTAELGYGVNLTNMTGANSFQFCAICLPTAGNSITWGVGPPGTGGFISSTATSSAPNILFATGALDVQFSGTTSVAVLPSRIQLTPVSIAVALAVTCNAGAEGEMLFIKDTTGAAAPTFHLIVAGSGATTVNSLATCNGSNWVYD